jgi:hypothetical protein
LKHYEYYLLVEEPVLLFESLVLGGVALDEPLLLGELLELELLPPLMPDELLPAAPLELEPDLDLLKCVSQSAREIWPSPLVSTDEKLGVDWLLDEPPDDLSEWLLELPPDAAGEDDEDEDGVLLDEPLELPDAAGADDGDEDGVLDEPLELLLPVAEGDDVDDEDLSALSSATARVDSANSTAAAMILTDLGMD